MWTYEETPLILKVWMLILALVIAARFHPRRIRALRSFKRWARRLSTKPLTCGLIIMSLSLLISATLTAMRYPLPWTHDEFSYLLASDTFAKGRLTNPTHPFWEHFETFHVIQQPSYMSKYPPGNGLALATGQALTGHAIVGAWLSLALACLAVYWMFRAWLPGHWALLAGVLVALNAPLLRAWGQSYWGGAVALLGGALVFGGLRRVWTRGRARDACLMAVGMVILANSRPLEGFLACLPVCAALLVWLIRNKELKLGDKLCRVAIPTAVIGVLGITAMLLYNQAICHDSLALPYKIHDQRYSASSLVIWKSPPPSPAYNHARMDEFYHQWGRNRQLNLREWNRYAANLGRKFRLLWDFTPLAMGVCLLALPWTLRSGWSRFAILIVLGVLLIESQLATSWMYPHYLAPILALFLVLNVQGLRHLRLLARNRQWGVWLGRAVLVFAVLKLVPTFIDWQKPTRLHPRQAVTAWLERDPGPHLVFVSYNPDYRIVDEWVFNEANIDEARIVWARDMGCDKNRALIDYFGRRKVWRWNLSEADELDISVYRPEQASAIVVTAR